MSSIDQKKFTDAWAKYKANSGFFSSNTALMREAFSALNRMAMFDMLPALATMTADDRLWFVGSMLDDINVVGRGAFRRLESAAWVIDHREIRDFELPDEQVNDERQFLGCTRLDRPGVQAAIDDAMSKARAIAPAKYPDETCCGVLKAAWSPVLVSQRRVRPGASLISNLAAAAHYMLARYHVCAALATPWQMKIVIQGYDEKKRSAIANGDRDLKSMALTPGNPPFPPDFAIGDWAKKGADDGEADRKNCNSGALSPLIFPDVNGSDA